MKLIKPNCSEWIFYLLNAIFIVIISYFLFFVSLIWLSDKDSHQVILGTKPLSFIVGRFLIDVFFIVLTMVPVYIANNVLNIFFKIKKKSILIRVMFIEFLILVVYSIGLLIGSYGNYLINL